MRKLVFVKCENGGADQLCDNRADQMGGNRAADQRLCFRYRDRTSHLPTKPLATFCGCTARFELDPEDSFSRGCGSYISYKCLLFYSLSRLFHLYRDEPMGRWGETGVPRENHLTHPQAELGLSHMWISV